MRAVSRALDIAISGAVLLVLAPLLGLIALGILLILGRPVFFRQARPGLHGRPFTCIKFRTMSEARDADGRLLPDEERMTRFGSLLREISLDELPQLWNVLRGDMALVGPRPLLMEYLPRYNAQQMKRHEVKPGITGWVQINGRNALSWRLRDDLGFSRQRRDRRIHPELSDETNPAIGSPYERARESLRGGSIRLELAVDGGAEH